MNNDISKHFVARIRAGIDPKSTSLVRFITEETFLNMEKYSFFGHEYQEYFVNLIERDPNVDITGEKCSQIGLSEICFRIVLGLMALNPGYGIIYAMPSKSFAMEVLKTRISLIIDNSPALRALISRDVDSASVKMFNNASILFALGASSNSSQSLINRPVTLALTDELDKCDYDTHSGFRSRQTHSKHKPRIAISTPTVPGVGINAEAEGRQIHYQAAICSHCKHEFIPDYYEQVTIPGFDEPISTLTKEKIRQNYLDITKAYHFCPKCHKTPDLSPKYRYWVIEDEHLTKIHVKFSPFDAPYFITPEDLVTSQLTFSSRAEFDNQSLGKPCRIEDATIDRTSIKFVNDVPGGIPVAGLDLGKNSYYMKGNIIDERIFIDKFEIIPVGELKNRIDYLVPIDKLTSLVSDSLPFLDVVHTLTQRHPMFWGATYEVPNQPWPELYKLKINKEDQVRQVRIQKNLFMDHVAALLNSEQIIFKNGPLTEQILQHITDMRRVRDHKFSEMRYKWMKSAKGVDHWFHALVYLVCASKLLMKSGVSQQLPMDTMLSSFKCKTDV